MSTCVFKTCKPIRKNGAFLRFPTHGKGQDLGGSKGLT